MSDNGGKGDFIISINGFCFSLLSFNHSGNFNSGMSSQMFSTSSSNFRCFNNRDGSRNKRGNRDLRCNWKGNIGISCSNREVGGSNSESIDRVRNVLSGLKDAIGIHILISSSGHSKGIPGLSLGRVDVVIAKAELTKLILSMELAGGS